jgi:Putative beta-barrel porin-2, OmpL-like. bbp2/Carboxypeptidase regulatory-like domain
MKVRRFLRGPLIAALAAVLTAPATLAAENPPAALGAIVGIVTNSANNPVARATVTARRADGHAIHATLSGNDGVYSFADLAPGTWSVTVHVDGYPDVSRAALEVSADQAARYDVIINAQVAAAAAAAPAAAAPAAVAPASTVPEALQAPAPAPAVDTVTPWADVGYLGWLNGNSRESAPIFDTKFFTPEIRLDVNYLQDFNNPRDHTISGSTEEFRSGEFQIEQVSFGGDFHWENVRARFLSMMGLFAVTTPRNDASAGVGQWDLQGAYKYMSEANAGYHWDVAHGLNVDLGIFVSYIGLFSYYNFDNWTYQPSFVSSNTPWFFNGMRVQFWPTQHLKIEPWLINGWQSYAKFNDHPGFGGQVLYIPNDWLKLVFNSYTFGQDNLGPYNNQGINPCNGGNPNADIGSCNAVYQPVNYARVQRMHEDDSILVKYYENSAAGAGISRMAFSFTADVGCEYGGGTSCTRGPNKENFVGLMLYDRTWWDNNVYALTLGGGFMNNPGRYLALLPPINGATAATGSPYFTENPGQKLYQWDSQLNFQYMPKDWITWWTEATFRHSDVPYWTGQGGITSPAGNAAVGNSNPPTSTYCNNGSVSDGIGTCGAAGGDWFPDLRKREVIWGAGVMVKF